MAGAALPSELVNMKRDAKEAIDREDFKAALFIYDQTIQKAEKLSLPLSDATKLLCNRSMVHFSLQNFEKSLEDAEECCKVFPQFPMGHYRRSLALAALNKKHQALEAIVNALHCCKKFDGNIGDEAACFVELILLLCKIEDEDSNLELPVPETDNLKTLILNGLIAKDGWIGVHYVLCNSLQVEHSELAGCCSECSCSHMSLSKLLEDTTLKDKKQWGCKLAIKMLKNGASYLELKEKLENEVIHYAIQLSLGTGDVEFLKYLLATYAKSRDEKNAVNKNGDTVLHVLVKKPHVLKTTLGETMIGILINHGCDTNLKDKDGKTPIQYLSKDNNVFQLFSGAVCVKTLGTSEENVLTKDTVPTQETDRDIKKMTLQQCLDQARKQNAKDHEEACKWYAQAIYKSVESSKMDLFKIILKEICISYYNLRDKRSEYPNDIHDFLKLDIHPDTWALVLFDFIAEKNKKMSIFAKVQFEMALRRPFPLTIKLDIRQVNNLKSLCNLKFLQKCPFCLDFFQYLIVHGCDRSTISTQPGDTFLHAAVRITIATDNFALLMFLSSNSNPNLTDSQGNTALHVTALEQNNSSFAIEIVRILQSMSINPYIKTKKGKLAVECINRRVLFADKLESFIIFYMMMTKAILKTETEKDAGISPSSATLLELRNEQRKKNIQAPSDTKDEKPTAHLTNKTQHEKMPSTLEDNCRCDQNLTKYQNTIDEKPQSTLKDLTKLIKNSKHGSKNHQRFIENSVKLFADYLAFSSDRELPEDTFRISHKLFTKLVKKMIDRQEWKQVYYLIKKHVEIHKSGSNLAIKGAIPVSKVLQQLMKSPKQPKLQQTDIICMIDLFIQKCVCQPKDQKTCIQLAVGEKYFELLELLVCKFEMDPQYITLTGGDTPIHAALNIALSNEKGNLNIFRNCLALYSKNPNKYNGLNPKQLDCHNESVFHLLAKGKTNKLKESAFNILIEKNVFAESMIGQNEDGKYPKDYITRTDPRSKMLQEVSKCVKEKSKKTNASNTTKMEAIKNEETETTILSSDREVKPCQDKAKERKKTEVNSTPANTQSYLKEIESMIQSLSYVTHINSRENKKREVDRASVNRQLEVTESSKVITEEISKNSEEQIETSTSTTPINLWEVVYSNDVHKILSDSHTTELIKSNFGKIVKALQSGEFRNSITRQLSTKSDTVKLFEANITKSSRLIWEIGVDFSQKQTEMNDGKEKIYSQIIRLWDIAIAHKDIEKSVKVIVKKIKESHRKGATCLEQKPLKCLLSSESDLTDNTIRKYPKLYVEATDETDTGHLSLYPPASAKDSEYNTIKFYNCSPMLQIIQRMTLGRKVDFPFRLTDKEYEITTLPFTYPIILIGRSGTGKTTCCLFRLWHAFQSYWTYFTETQNVPEISEENKGQEINEKEVEKPAEQQYELLEKPTRVLRKNTDLPWTKHTLAQKIKEKMDANGKAGIKRTTEEAEERLQRNCRFHRVEYRGDTPKDGNCFFHAVCDQMQRIGLQTLTHDKLRFQVSEFVRENPVYEGEDGIVDIKGSVGDVESFSDIISKPGEYADHVVVQYTAKLLQQNIKIITSYPDESSEDAFQWIYGKEKKENDDKNYILLGHVWENHYQSLQFIDDALCQTCNEPSVPDFMDLYKTSSVFILTNAADKESNGTDKTSSTLKPSTEIRQDTELKATIKPSASHRTEKEQHLRQIFITKNKVLCKEVKQTFREFMNGDQNTALYAKFRRDDYDLPIRLQDIDQYQYPLMITAKELWLVLDATVGPPYFFDRNVDGSLKAEIDGWAEQSCDLLFDIFDVDEGNDYISESESGESDDEDGDDDDDGNDDEITYDSTVRERKTNQLSTTSKKDPRKEVSYEVFAEQIWPKLITKTKKFMINKSGSMYHSSLVWTEIMSFIKGSYKAICADNGYLSLNEYLDIGQKRAPVYNSERENIYEFFKAYEHFRKQHCLFDQTDLVRDIYKRLLSLDNRKWGIQQIYVDEAQDFTQAELYLLISLCESTSGMFLTGDTAQSIMKGISFRFKDVRSLFHHASQSTKETPKDVKGLPEKIHSLPINYRSHSGITLMASKVLDVMYHYFPQSFDKLPEERSLFVGPKPILLESGETEDLLNILSSNKREASEIEFGAHQAILVASDEARDKIPKDMKGAIILTLYEAKGLEFDDVLLYNIFTESQASKEWRLVTTFLIEQLNKSNGDGEHGTLVKNVESRPLEFDKNMHQVLNAELKNVYTAITRARTNVWIFDENKEKRLPMFEFFQLLNLAEMNTGTENSFAKKSSLVEWLRRGEDFMKREQYNQAEICFKYAGNVNKEKTAVAFAHYQQAINPALKSKQMKDELLQATIKFLDVNQANNAAVCLQRAGYFQLAAQIYEKTNKLKMAAGVYRKIKNADKASKLYEEIGRYDLAIDVLVECKLFEAAAELRKKVSLIQDNGKLRNHPPRDDQSVEQLDGLAVKIFHEKGDIANMLKALKEIDDISYKIHFLEQRVSENENYLQYAADILSQQGKRNDAPNLYLKYGKTQQALEVFMRNRNVDMIGQTLLIQTRIKIQENSDGSVTCLPEDRQVVQKNLEDAIECFMKGLKHPKGYMRRLSYNFIGETCLLLGKITADQSIIGHAFGRFRWWKPYRNYAGELDCLNWMVYHSNLQNRKNVFKVIKAIGVLFDVLVVVSSDPREIKKDFENELKVMLHHFGLDILENDISMVYYNPLQRPLILQLLKKEKDTLETKTETAREVIPTERVCRILTSYYMFKGSEWYNRILQMISKLQKEKRDLIDKQLECLDGRHIKVQDHSDLLQVDCLNICLTNEVKGGVDRFQKRKTNVDLEGFESKTDEFTLCNLLIADFIRAIKQYKDFKMSYSFYREGEITAIKSCFLRYLSDVKSSAVLEKSLGYFMGVISYEALLHLQIDVRKDITDLEKIAQSEYSKNKITRKRLFNQGFMSRADSKAVVLSKVRPFYEAFTLLQKRDIFGALKKFSHFINLIKGKWFDDTYIETHNCLLWLQYFTFVGFCMKQKNLSVSQPNQTVIGFLIPESYRQIVNVVQRLIKRPTGELKFPEQKWNNEILMSFFENSIAIIRGAGGGLLHTIFKIFFKYEARTDLHEDSHIMSYSRDQAKDVFVLAMIYIINMFQIRGELYETGLLQKIIDISDEYFKCLGYDNVFIEEMKNATCISHLCSILHTFLLRNGEKLLICSWKTDKKVFAHIEWSTDTDFHKSSAKKIFGQSANSNHEKKVERSFSEQDDQTTEEAIDEYEHSTVLETNQTVNQDEIDLSTIENSTAETHTITCLEKYAQDVLFKDFIVNSSRCDVCGEELQIDMEEEDVQSRESDGHANIWPTPSHPITLRTISRSLVEKEELKSRNLNLGEHLRSAEHARRMHDFSAFLNRYSEIKHNLESLESFIHKFKLDDSENLKNVYVSDDFRILKLVSEYKKNKESLIEFIKCQDWTNPKMMSLADTFIELTKKMNGLKDSVEEAFLVHTSPKKEQKEETEPTLKYTRSKSNRRKRQKRN